MKNKLIALTLVLSLVFSLSACGNNEEKEKTSENEKKTEEQENSQKEADKVEIENEKEKAGEDQKKDEVKEESVLEKIEETVLLEQEGIKITALEIEDDGILGKNLILLLENNSDKKYTIYVDSMVVNDFMISDLFFGEVAAGKKAKEKVHILSESLKDSGINKIAKIELKFRVTEENSFESVLESDLISIETSEKDSVEDSKLDEGQVVLDQNNIKIIAKEIKPDSLFGAELPIYIENNSDKDISLYLEDVSVNGFMISSLFSSDVLSGKKALDNLTVMWDSLQENDIEEIEEIEFVVRVREKDKFDIILETEPIQLNFK